MADHIFKGVQVTTESPGDNVFRGALVHTTPVGDNIFRGRLIAQAPSGDNFVGQIMHFEEHSDNVFRGARGEGGAAPVLGPLDAFSGQLYTLTGMHRAFSSYTGPICRVRRTSDNAETDIGYTADGWADIGQMLAFAAGGSLTIVRDYDKTGNGRDGLPPANTNQPRVVLNGVLDAGVNGKPAPVYNGTSTFMDIQNSVGFSRNRANLTCATISRATGAAATQIVINWPIASAANARGSLYHSGSSTSASTQIRSTDVGAFVTLLGASLTVGQWARLIGRGRFTAGGVDISVNGTTATNATLTPAQNTPDSDQFGNVRVGAVVSSVAGVGAAFVTGNVAMTALAQSALDMAAFEAGLAQMMP